MRQDSIIGATSSSPSLDSRTTSPPTVTIVVIPLVSLLEDMAERCISLARKRFRVLRWSDRRDALKDAGGIVLVSA